MATYRIELEDGGAYDVEIDDSAPKTSQPQQKKEGIDFGRAFQEGASSSMNPSAQNIGQGGLDIAQRFGQGILGSVYGQARQQGVGMVPEQVRQNLGRGITAGVLPMANNFVSPKIQQEIGNQATGLGIDIASGLGVSGADALGEKVSSTLSKAVSRNIDLSGAKGFRSVAENINKALKEVNTQFKNEYNTVMNKVGNKYVPTELKSKIIDTIKASSRELDDQSMRGLNAIEEDLRGATAKELHSIKQRVYKMGKSSIGSAKNAYGNVYDAISEVLSNPKVFGEEYKQVTDKFKEFASNEGNYLNALVKDKFGKVTETKLASKGGQLDINKQEALDLLSKRTGTSLSRGLKKVRRGETAKTFGKEALRFSPYVLGGGYISYRVLRDLLG